MQQFPVNTLKEKTTKTNEKTYVKKFKLNTIYVDTNKNKKIVSPRSIKIRCAYFVFSISLESYGETPAWR